MATVTALTDVNLIILKRNDFWFIFGDEGDSKVMSDLKGLLESRKTISLGPLVK